MKNIAIFVKNLNSGGAEKQSVLLAKALANNYIVHYIIFDSKKIHRKYLDILERDKINIITFNGGYCARFKQLVYYLKNNNIKSMFSYLTAANTYACIAGKISGTKVFTGLRNAELPQLKCIVERLLTNYFCEKAIVNCYSGRRKFILQDFKENRMVVIPNCFDNIENYYPKKYSEKIHIITVGRFVPQKDYETAIRTIANIKTKCKYFIFDIVGYGPLEQQIRNWIKYYAIDDVTNIYINPDNIPELLKKADIYLSTSLFEGTSNSIMEGMNANLPIVATNVGDNNYLIKNGVNGFLSEVKDHIALTESLFSLINNTELRIKMGENSKTILIEKFTINQFRDSYLDLLNNI
ncbi:MAG: glycosyltransferase family 4 protein [Bacteroides sp.]|nr:glycosyltransferase family 4 protein [Bacteroides sp.]